MASHNHKLLTPVLALMAFMNIDAQSSQEIPRLVVNIIVDQLRTDYMEAFTPLYKENGFKRLLKEGLYYSDVQYPFKNIDRASATACYATGATPYDNGIPSLTWLSRNNLCPVFCVDNKPTYLLTTTLSDEMEMASANASIVYSIAPEKEIAILMAGHISDGAFWIDNIAGEWSASSYYNFMPTWVKQFNKEHSFNSLLQKTIWEPTFNKPAQDFHYLLSVDTTLYNFSHDFYSDCRFTEFKTSALINEEVALMVDVCLAHTSIGADRVPDILNIGLYAGNYLNAPVNKYPAELQDIYVRLDKALAHIFSSVDQIVGRQRVLYVLSSTGYNKIDAQPQDFTKNNIPTGTFDMHRAAMLLNMYLSALYGQAQYVISSHENQIYLDHQLIEQRQLQLSDVTQRCGDFISQMKGVSNTYTTKSIISSAGNASLEKVRNGWNANCSGDVLIEVHPGWNILTEEKTEIFNCGNAYTNYPLFFLGNNIQSERISLPLSVATVAPTLAKYLRIRAPNGSYEIPLEITK